MRLISIIFLCCELAASAVSLEEARQLAEDGDTPKAIATLHELIEAEPKNTAAEIALGDLLWSIGEDEDAVAAYASARAKGAREGILALANVAVLQYRPQEARDLLAAYRATLKKGRKVLAQDASGDLEERISQIDNALTRVQQIEVIDSLVVDAEDFFNWYRLTPESGHIAAPADQLPQGFEAAEPSTLYVTENGQTMLWAQPDTAGTAHLVRSIQLYGGEWEQPQELGMFLNNGGDANYPFLMPDGITLYYASDGEGTLGGLDIWISRANDQGEFLQPQNLGMPFNSPYDDYLLAVDELTGAGWWATDRNRIPGKVTIYIYVPQELRVNVSPEAADLQARALVKPIRTTWEQGKDYNALRRSIADIPSGKSGAHTGMAFQFAMPSGKVYTRLEQLHTPRARALMRQYVAQKAELDKAQRQLDADRIAYGRGDRSLAAQITTAERAMPQLRRDLRDLANEIISMEQ